MKSTEELGVCSRRDSASACASLDGGVSDIHVTCVHQSLHSSSVDVLSQEMMCHLSCEEIFKKKKRKNKLKKKTL